MGTTLQVNNSNSTSIVFISFGLGSSYTVKMVFILVASQTTEGANIAILSQYAAVTNYVDGFAMTSPL